MSGVREKARDGEEEERREGGREGGERTVGLERGGEGAVCVWMCVLCVCVCVCV